METRLYGPSHNLIYWMILLFNFKFVKLFSWWIDGELFMNRSFYLDCMTARGYLFVTVTFMPA